MNDLLLSAFSLCASNNGEFKSEKQANFFYRMGVDNEIYRVETFSFGEHGGCRRQIGYSAKFDNQGITKIVKSDAKGEHVMFERGGINTYAAKRNDKLAREEAGRKEVLEVDIPNYEANIAALEKKASDSKARYDGLVKSLVGSPAESVIPIITRSEEDTQREIAADIQSYQDSITHLKKTFHIA